MKILCVCDQGNNRSVQFAHLLKYWGHETIPIGIKTTSMKTMDMLYEWADKIIITESEQRFEIFPDNESILDKIVLFDVGVDDYPRPFNKELHEKAKKYLEENKDWLKGN